MCNQKSNSSKNSIIFLYLSINALNLNANGVKMGFYQGNFLYHYKED